MRRLLQVGALAALGLSVSGCGEKAPPSQIDLPYGKWSHFKNKDPITDVESISIVLSSQPLADGDLTPAELHVRCLGGNLEIYVSWNRYIGSEHNVDSRIDSDQHQPNKWSASSDGKSSFYPYVDKDYLKRIRSSEKYIVRVESFGGRSLTAHFNTTKLNEEAGPTIDSCTK